MCDPLDRGARRSSQEHQPVLEHVPEEGPALSSASATPAHRAALLAARHSTDGAVGSVGPAADGRPGPLAFRQKATTAMDGSAAHSYHKSRRLDVTCDTSFGSCAPAAAVAAAAAADVSWQGRLAPLRTWDERCDADQQLQQLLPSPALIHTPQVPPPPGPLARTAASNGVSHLLPAGAAVPHGAVSGSQCSGSTCLMGRNSSPCGTITCADSPTLACVPCTPVALTAAAAPLAPAAQGEGSQSSGVGGQVAAEEGLGPSNCPRTPLLAQQGSNGAASPPWGGFGAMGDPLVTTSQLQGCVQPGSSVWAAPTSGVVAFEAAVPPALGGGPLPSLGQGPAVAPPPTPILALPGSASGSLSGAAEPAAPHTFQHQLQHHLLQRRVWSRLSRTHSDCDSLARTTATSICGGGRTLLRQEDSTLSVTDATAALQAFPWAGGLTRLQLQVRSGGMMAHCQAGIRVGRSKWQWQVAAAWRWCVYHYRNRWRGAC